MVKTFMTIMFIVCSIVVSMKSLYDVQQNSYRFRPTFDIKAFGFVALTLLPVSILGTVFDWIAGLVATLALIFVAMVFLRSYLNRRTKFKFTERGTRLFLVSSVLICLVFSIFNLVLTQIWAEILVLSAVVSLTNFIVGGASLIINPFEKRYNQKFIERAKQKIGDLNAVKIGITGSFGKTSCKNILAAMLLNKYKVIKTAENYNTPMGICLTANKIEGDEEIFIAEMGARRRGDIKELCDIVRPTYAIITGVSNQHLQTFGTQENTFKTKKELVDAIPEDGFVVFNGDNEGAVRMIKDCQSEVSIVHLNKEKGIFAKNVKLTNSGSSFLVVGLGEEFALTTRLLGRHNILNILLCAAMAYRLGISVPDIVKTVADLKPTPHRLELIENKRDITIIDDSYNCNYDGAAFSLEVLKQFEGRRVVFTQGIVELGNKQYEINFNLGVMIAETADVVLLTGQNAESIKDGLKKSGFMGEIHCFDTFFDVKESFASLLKMGDVLLIQNDIP